ncbi:MAG TPA: HDOD domain-containing protein [Phycisphaerales bacterium]|nr:HDOD domain-containing protein [Phycisphaerales bacterium]
MKRVLVVDDLTVIREPIAAALRREGFDAVCAANGREAIGLMRTQPPDLILLDLGMPEMDGLELLRRMKTDATLPSPPVVVLTAAGDKDSVLKSRQLGVRHYLLKAQFSLADMVARVRELTSDRREEASAGAGAAVVAQRDGESGVAGRVGGGTPGAGTVGVDSGSTASVVPTPAEAAAALRNIKPRVVRSELVEMLDRCGELKALPPSVAEVLKVVNSSQANSEQVAGVIKRDPAIALKILRLANSSAFASGTPADTVEKAVLRIGVGAIRQAVMSIGVVDRFSSVAVEGFMDPVLFWEHSIAVGLIAAAATRARGEGEPDAAFTMGLLHDMGRVVYAELLRDKYAEVLASAEELGAEVERVESRMLLMNHAEGMDRILRAWHFPRDLVDPIVFHHLPAPDIRRNCPKRYGEVATLALADRLAHAFMLGSSGNDALYPTDELCRGLGLADEVIAEIERTIEGETETIKLAMLASPGRTMEWKRRVDHHARALCSPVRPLFVSASPACDAYRIALDRLRAAGDEPANVGVVHFSSPADRLPVSQAYASAEADAGVGRLPLIVLSQEGTVAPEESVAEGRRVLMLPTPTPMARLTGALNAAVEACGARAAA